MGESLEDPAFVDQSHEGEVFRVRWISKVSGETFTMATVANAVEAERMWHAASADPVCMEAWIETRTLPPWQRRD